MKKPLIERFFDKVNKTDDCWLWLASVNTGGYSRFYVEGKFYTAHRWYFEYLNGPLDKNLQLDHLCRVRHCVNPLHLEPVSQQENIRRGEAGKKSAEKQKAKTHCPYGHVYDKVNTRANHKGRGCKACHRIREAKRRFKQTNNFKEL